MLLCIMDRSQSRFLNFSAPTRIFFDYREIVLFYLMHERIKTEKKMMCILKKLRFKNEMEL